MLINGHGVAGGFKNHLPFDFEPYQFSNSAISEPFSMNHYLVFNRLFNGYKSKRSASTGRVLIDPQLFAGSPFYVVKQYSVRKPFYAKNQEPVETDNEETFSSGEAIKKSEFLSNPYIMLRP